jgi:hypothetical protein
MNRRYLLLGVAILVVGGWLEYQRRNDSDTQDDEYMWCQTATACAAYIEKSYLADLNAGAADFSAVRSQGTVVTVVYDLESVRADFIGGKVEDGRELPGLRWRGLARSRRRSMPIGALGCPSRAAKLWLTP